MPRRNLPPFRAPDYIPEEDFSEQRFEELSQFYQPMRSVQTDQIHGYEAITRRKALSENTAINFGLVHPEDLARRNLATDYWSIYEACVQLAFSKNRRRVRFHLNISHESLMLGPLLIREIDQLVQSMKIPPEFLVLQVSRIPFDKSPNETKFTLMALAELGISLSYVGLISSDYDYVWADFFNFKYIKLDASLAHSESEDQLTSIYSKIQKHAHDKKITTVADGTSTIGELIILRELGVDHYQGPLSGKISDSA